MNNLCKETAQYFSKRLGYPITISERRKNTDTEPALLCISMPQLDDNGKPTELTSATLMEGYLNVFDHLSSLIK